jgi:RNA polymerase sigma-70 factor (ECF subfamily)
LPVRTIPYQEPLMTQQDWMLMHRIADGDEEAVAELYDRFASLVYKVSRQLLPTVSDADDAVQEIFVRLWRTADRYDPRRAKLVTWVMLITRRHLIDRLRRSAVRPHTSALDVESAAPEDGRPPERDPSTDERNAGLYARIADLPELQRTVIERAYLQGFTLREISEQLGSPLGTIKSALSRGLARLRDRAAGDQAM